MRLSGSGLISIFFVLLGFSISAFARKHGDERFTVYMLDPGGSFIQTLSDQINQHLPLNFMPMSNQNLELHGEITLTFAGSLIDQVDLYTISRAGQDNTRPDMDSSEVYQLVVVKQPDLLTPDDDIKHRGRYSYYRQGSRWYVKPYGTLGAQDSGHQTMILGNGVFNMLNIANTHKLTVKRKPHKFMEIIGSTGRQSDFLSLLDHPNIIKLQHNPDIGLSLQLLEYYDNNLQDFLKDPDNIPLAQLLMSVSWLADAMADMHRANVAHGEIALENILFRFAPYLHVDLSNFSRACKVDAVSDTHIPGCKKFTFYNKHSSSPEMRFPKGPTRPWEYTSATLRGDIWSFGFMLAAIMYIYPETHELAEQLQLNRPLKDFYVTPEGEPDYDPSKLAPIASTVPLTVYIKQSRLKAPDTTLTLSPRQESVFGALVRLINRTTHRDAKLRPTAEEVFKELRQIARQLQAIS